MESEPENDEELLRTPSFGKIPENIYWEEDESTNSTQFDGSEVFLPPIKMKPKNTLKSGLFTRMCLFFLDSIWIGRNYLLPISTFFLGIIFTIMMQNFYIESLCEIHIQTRNNNIIPSPEEVPNDDTVDMSIAIVDPNFHPWEKCPFIDEEINDVAQIDTDSKSGIFCFSKDKSSVDVCSAHGICVSENLCECFNNFSGPECEYCHPLYFGNNCSRERLLFHPGFDSPEYSVLKTRVMEIFDTNIQNDKDGENKYQSDEKLVFVALLDNVAKYNLEYGKFLKKVFEKETANFTNIEDPEIRFVILLLRKEEKFKKYPDEKCVCFGDCQTCSAIQQLLNKVTFGEVIVKIVFRVNFEKEVFDFTDCEVNEISIKEIKKLIVNNK